MNPRGTEMTKLSTPLFELKGVGPKFFERLKRLNIATVEDLLWHFPFRYEDFSKISKIADLKIGQSATISGMISDIKLHRTWKRRMFIVEALVSDDTGSIKAIWFNQRFLLSILKKGKLVNLAGKVVSDPKQGIILAHPIYEIINQGFNEDGEEVETKHTGRLIPIYPETKRVTSKALRFLIKPILEDLEKLADPIPPEILQQYNFPEINEALNKIHFPEELREAKISKKRFAFEDLFFLQLTNLRQRLKLAREKACGFEVDIEYIKSLISRLPFELTKSQKVALWDILKDLKRSQPMNRLLQGDVGSGKTVVAALAALVVAKGGYQTAFMAPTEVLARQHFETLKNLFLPFNQSVNLGFIAAGGARVFYGDDLESETKKNQLVKSIEDNKVQIVIGTHALIQKNIKFGNLGFVIIDEQHRFGVAQRASLMKGSIHNYVPHLLSMSATPIPRTLTLTIFGDLDLSTISEMPPGRKSIITKIVAPANRDKAYDFIREQVKKGRQIFVICPRIEKENAGDRILSSREISRLEIKSVKEEYEKLSQKVFPDLRVALLHGKMKAKEKTDVMSGFKEGKYDILVSTSVIEVGVDIPNATIMMIEGSDRFGLAQLYQFRGRVGRGGYQSFCLLFTDSAAKTTYKRLHSLIEAKNGFELAEKDLEIRGPGEFLGESQTGRPDLAMKAVQNPELVKASREAAEKIIKVDPELKKYQLLQWRLESFQKEIHLE